MRIIININYNRIHSLNFKVLNAPYELQFLIDLR